MIISFYFYLHIKVLAVGVEAGSLREEAPKGRPPTPCNDNFCVLNVIKTHKCISEMLREVLGTDNVDECSLQTIKTRMVYFFMDDIVSRRARAFSYDSHRRRFSDLNGRVVENQLTDQQWHRDPYLEDMPAVSQRHIEKSPIIIISDSDSDWYIIIFQ